MNMAEPEIVRKSQIVVDTVSTNSYGDLEFTDKGGKSYKVGAKRVNFFKDVIIPGKAIQLNYAAAYGKEYIWNAILIEHLIETKEPAVQPVKSQGSAPIPKGEPPPQAVGMATKEIGDMIRAKQLKLIFGDEAGTEILKWYRSQILGITRVSFDGAKLPDYKIKAE